MESVSLIAARLNSAARCVYITYAVLPRLRPFIKICAAHALEATRGWFASCAEQRRNANAHSFSLGRFHAVGSHGHHAHRCRFFGPFAIPHKLLSWRRPLDGLGRF